MKIKEMEVPVRWEMQLSNDEKLVLVGKIDRIDQNEDSFVIYDYKTGYANLKMKEEVQTGLKLQLPLYAIALRKQLEKEQGKKVQAQGASYISMRDPAKRAGNGIWRTEHIGKGSSYLVSSRCRNREDELGTEAFLEKYELKPLIEKRWREMSSQFSVRPLDCSKHCPYQAVCRVTEEQKEAKGSTGDEF